MILPHVSNRLLTLAPAVSTGAAETHSALVVSQQSFSGHVDFEASMETVEQLRVGAAPNPWETGWAVWDYTDNDHFYYLALKTNGWELGKRDPDYPGGQRFLATGSDIKFAVGDWTHFAVVQDGDTMTVSVDGHELARFQDKEHPYLGGKVGFYAEDAKVAIDNVTGSVSDDFQSDKGRALHDGSAIGDAWRVAFLGYGAGSVGAAPGAPGDLMVAAAHGVAEEPAASPAPDAVVASSSIWDPGAGSMPIWF